MRSALEQSQLIRVAGGLTGIVIGQQQEARVDDPATRQGVPGLDPVQLPVSFGQDGAISAENGLLVQVPGLFHRMIHAGDRTGSLQALGGGDPSLANVAEPG